MITIIDYGMGNLGSIIHTLRRMDIPTCISSNPQDILEAEKIILPGVGSFDKGMERLTALGIISTLEEAVLDNNTPILGICLGMQLFGNGSEEGGSPGLGWVDAETIRFKVGHIPKIKIPHMGWNNITVHLNKHITSGVGDDDRFYFVHSYHLSSIEDHYVIGTTTYGVEFPSIIQKGNIIGIQCHPERSHRSGLKILQNFVEI